MVATAVVVSDTGVLQRSVSPEGLNCFTGKGARR